MRKFSDLYNSNKDANTALLLSVLMAISYKAWKWYLRDIVNLDPIHDYFNYETYSTFFRYFGAVICLVTAYNLHNDKSNLLKTNSRLVFFPLLLFPLGFFVIKSHLFGFSFLYVKFMQELPINFGVGFWEESLFRGLLFTSLCRYMKTSYAVIFSGLLFTAWHFDLDISLQEFVGIFLVSYYFTLIYILGASIFQISVLHFIWDQIHFGFIWGEGSLNYLVHTYIFVVSIILTFFIYSRLKPTEKIT